MDRGTFGTLRLVGLGWIQALGQGFLTKQSTQLGICILIEGHCTVRPLNIVCLTQSRMDDTQTVLGLSDGAHLSGASCCTWLQLLSAQPFARALPSPHPRSSSTHQAQLVPQRCPLNLGPTTAGRPLTVTDSGMGKISCMACPMMHMMQARKNPNVIPHDISHLEALKWNQDPH